MRWKYVEGKGGIVRGENAKIEVHGSFNIELLLPRTIQIKPHMEVERCTSSSRFNRIAEIRCMIRFLSCQDCLYISHVTRLECNESKQFSEVGETAHITCSLRSRNGGWLDTCYQLCIELFFSTIMV